MQWNLVVSFFPDKLFAKQWNEADSRVSESILPHRDALRVGGQAILGACQQN